MTVLWGKVPHMRHFLNSTHPKRIYRGDSFSLDSYGYTYSDTSGCCALVEVCVHYSKKRFHIESDRSSEKENLL